MSKVRFLTKNRVQKGLVDGFLRSLVEDLLDDLGAARTPENFLHVVAAFREVVDECEREWSKSAREKEKKP